MKQRKKTELAYKFSMWHYSLAQWPKFLVESVRNRVRKTSSGGMHKVKP